MFYLGKKNPMSDADTDIYRCEQYISATKIFKVDYSCCNQISTKCSSPKSTLL